MNSPFHLLERKEAPAKLGAARYRFCEAQMFGVSAGQVGKSDSYPIVIRLPSDFFAAGRYPITWSSCHSTIVSFESSRQTT